MKITSTLLPLVTAIAVAALIGCAKTEQPTASASAPKAVAAGPREIEVTSNDAMKFSLTEIRAKPGEELSVTLVNLGTMPKQAMGHNWVLVDKSAKVDAFAMAAAAASATEYIPAAQKDQVLAATKILGPKQTETITFKAPTEPGRYPFLCTFPGHFQVGMKGELVVE